jgi:hypothetical protein
MHVTIDDAKKMDLILSYLIKNKIARVKYKQIMDLLNIDLEKAKFLHESILKFHNEVQPIISIHNALNIAEKPLETEKFLESGGFEAIYTQKADVDAIRLEKSHSYVKKGINSWLSNHLWIILLTSILGFLFGLISLLISLKIIKLG